MTESQFKMKFSNYKNALNVKPFVALGANEQRPYYYDYISRDITAQAVELIRYYNQDTDEFVLIANGVWLNPLPTDKIMPLPFKHKQLPFWKAIYEPFGSDFFYGK